MNQIAALIGKILSRIGLVLIRKSTFDSLTARSQYARKFAILTRLGRNLSSRDFELLLSKSKSQLDQDLAALAVCGMKRSGYFVEFGATDGKSLSNTFLLENDFEWTGILAEPGMEWQSKLRENRKAITSSKAVWSSSGKSMKFIENAELSTLAQFKNSDMHSRSGRTYNVETISLIDLLDSNNAPSHIDFLSVDTEGSEFEVLNAFNFEKYSFSFICVEHNYTQSRELVLDLLQSKGYVRVLEDVSEWDDWFVPAAG